MYIAAIDPGSDKCGFALLDGNGKALIQKVVMTDELCVEVMKAYEQYPFNRLMLGNGTTSANAEERIGKLLPSVKVEVVDEYRTTELGRKDYFKDHPPSGLKRFLPQGLLTPPVPVDDYAAAILARRALGLESPERSISER